MSSRDGRMVPSTTNKKDLDVVTLLVTAERERDSFFCWDCFLFFVYASPLFLSGASGGFLHLFDNYF